jgi:hypothetical protein
VDGISITTAIHVRRRPVIITLLLTNVTFINIKRFQRGSFGSVLRASQAATPGIF